MQPSKGLALRLGAEFFIDFPHLPGEPYPKDAGALGEDYKGFVVGKMEREKPRFKKTINGKEGHRDNSHSQGKSKEFCPRLFARAAIEQIAKSESYE